MTDTIADLRSEALDARAQALYSDVLPYHNFEHIEQTLSSADRIVARCLQENIRINLQVVYYALLFHDAGYHEDHRAKGHATREAYSAHLARAVLDEFDVPDRDIDKTLAAILATEKDASFVTVEQKVVRAADLSGMAGPYDQFLVKSLKLKRELEYLNNKEVTWHQWQVKSRDVLNHYMAQEIRLTSYFYNDSGESEFHAQVRENLRRLMAEPAEPQKSSA